MVRNMAGWAACGFAGCFGMLFYEHVGASVDVVMTAVVGFGLSIPMRYICRGLWDRRGYWVIFGVLAGSYVTVLALRILVHLADRKFIDPTLHFNTLFELFCGALPSTYVLACWSARVRNIRRDSPIPGHHRYGGVSG